MILAPGDLNVRQPIVDESLDGYVAAVTSDNDLVRLAHIARWGGVEHGHRPRLATLGWEALPELAALLEIDVAELQLRSYPVMAEDVGRRAFFGTTVHRSDVRTGARFFSPAALRASPHHRALWQLCFPFDTETGDVLVNACPRCKAVQRWRHSVGVRYCDHCVEDLAQAPTTTIPLDLLDDARRAVGLVHPDPGKRSAAVALLPDRLKEIDSGLVLELLLRMTPFVHPDCRWEKNFRYHRNDAVVLAEAISRAYQTLREWPAGALAIVSTKLAAAGRRFDDGNGGATIRFLRQRHNINTHPVIAGLVGELHDAMNLDGPHAASLGGQSVGVKETARITQLGTMQLSRLRRRGVLRTIPIMRGTIIVPAFDRPEVEALGRDIGRRLPLTGTTAKLGIPLYGVEQLVAKGLLETLEHPYFAERYGAVQTTEENLAKLHRQLLRESRASPEGLTPLLEGLTAIGGLKPWGTIVGALVEGRLPFHLDSGRASLAAGLRVDREVLLAVAAEGFDRDAFDFAFSKRLSRRDAGEILNLSPNAYTELFTSMASTGGPSVDVATVERLARDHIGVAEIAARARLSPQRALQAIKRADIVRTSLAGYPRRHVEAALLAAPVP